MFIETLRRTEEGKKRSVKDEPKKVATDPALITLGHGPAPNNPRHGRP